MSYGCAPEYLTDNFTLYNEIEQPYALRSADGMNVIVPYVNSSSQKK